jgi:hypothetical protein
MLGQGIIMELNSGYAERLFLCCMLMFKNIKILAA